MTTAKKAGTKRRIPSLAARKNTVVFGVQWSAEGRLELAPECVKVDAAGTMSLRRIDTWTEGMPGLTVLSLILPNPAVQWGHLPPYTGAGVMLLAEVPPSEIDPAYLQLLRRPVV